MQARDFRFYEENEIKNLLTEIEATHQPQATTAIKNIFICSNDSKTG